MNGKDANKALVFSKFFADHLLEFKDPEHCWHRESRDGEAEVGPRVQGLPGGHWRLHEPPAGQHRGVHRRQLYRQPGGGPRQVQTEI